MRQLFTISAAVLCCLTLSTAGKAAEAYVRVSQVGYEAGHAPYRAYLMSTVAEKGAMFHVLDEKGKEIYSAGIGSLLGTWSNSTALTYQV